MYIYIYRNHNTEPQAGNPATSARRFSPRVLGAVLGDVFPLVAEWIHFTLVGTILPTLKIKVYTFWAL